VSSSVTDLVRDAVEVVVDSTECSLVRRQASVLLSNVIWNVIHHPTSDLDNKVGWFIYSSDSVLYYDSVTASSDYMNSICIMKSVSH